MTCKDCIYAVQPITTMRCRNHGINMSDNAVVCNEFRQKKQTNGDKIRAMTDDELAEKLSFWDNSPLHASKEKWFDWLKQEAEE